MQLQTQTVNKYHVPNGGFVKMEVNYLTNEAKATTDTDERGVTAERKIRVCEKKRKMKTMY